MSRNTLDQRLSQGQARTLVVLLTAAAGLVWTRVVGVQLNPAAPPLLAAIMVGIAQQALP